MLALVNLKLLVVKLVIFKYKRSACTRNLKAISTGGVCRCGNENARCTVRIFAIAGNVVLYLNIVPFSKVAEGANLRGHHTHNPLEKV